VNPEDEPAEIRLIREVLEGILAPRLASVVMFETLADPLPERPEDLLAVVRGRLNQALVRRVGLEDANAVVRRLEALLGRSGPGPSGQAPGARRGPSSAPGASGARRIDPDTTQAIPLSTRPVGVLVVSAGRNLELRLAASLGPQRVAPSSVGDEDTLRRYAESGAATLLLVDATDFANIDPRNVADLLTLVPSSTARAVWGAELPYGRSVVRACEAKGTPCIALGRSEGIEPLLDLVRSRRAPF
jgi:hypothetical protein